jgi:hypothetical protein
LTSVVLDAIALTQARRIGPPNFKKKKKKKKKKKPKIKIKKKKKIKKKLKKISYLQTHLQNAIRKRVVKTHFIAHF